MALGKGVVAVTKHKKVIMIQFLKGNLSADVAEGLKMSGTADEGIPV